MSAPILATKLYAPPPRPRLVLRPRLIEKLNEGLLLQHRVSFIPVHLYERNGGHRSDLSAVPVPCAALADLVRSVEEALAGTTFWVLILLFSFLEPLGQLTGQMTPKVMENFGQFFVMMFLPMLLTNYPMGVAQAYLFRRYGFLASFMVRMGYYIIWHIVYGSLIYPLLNA